MAASIARKIAAVLFAMAMIGSVAVGPAVADDDDVDVGGDGVSVGGDDGISAGAGDNGSANGSLTFSISVNESGADSDLEASGGDGSGTSGSLDCDVGSDSPSDACETSGGDGPSVGLPGGGDAPSADAPEAPEGGSGGGGAATSASMDEITTPNESVEAPDLPVTYPDDVPFEAFPDFCNPPYGIDDVREANPVDPTDPLAGTGLKERAPSQVPTEPPSTPVGDPTGLVGLPISQCEVFNPYDPAVNPTSPPDDPRATVEPRYAEIGQDGVTLFALSDATTGQDAPAGETMALVTASRDFAGARFELNATDSQSYSGISGSIAAPTDGPNRGTYATELTLFSRSAGLIVECDGSECKPTATGVPSGGAIPAVPAGGGSDDGGDDGSSEPDPSADTGAPYTDADQDSATIYDDRSATLGDGLPSGENMVLITRSGDFVGARQDAQASGGGRQANVESTYASGQHPGDDDVYVLAKGEGAGVIVGLNCDDYRCTPTDNTGVYPGPASMLFEMIPDDPGSG